MAKQEIEMHGLEEDDISETPVTRPKAVAGEPLKGTIAYDRKYGKYTAKGALHKKPNTATPPKNESEEIDEVSAYTKPRFEHRRKIEAQIDKYIDPSKISDLGINYSPAENGHHITAKYFNLGKKKTVTRHFHADKNHNVSPMKNESEEIDEMDFGSIGKTLSKYGKGVPADGPKTPKRSTVHTDYTMTGHKEGKSTTGRVYTKAPEMDREPEAVKATAKTDQVEAPKRGRGRPAGAANKAGTGKGWSAEAKASMKAKLAARKAAKLAAANESEDISETQVSHYSNFERHGEHSGKSFYTAKHKDGTHGVLVNFEDRPAGVVHDKLSKEAAVAKAKHMAKHGYNESEEIEELSKNTLQAYRSKALVAHQKKINTGEGKSRAASLQRNDRKIKSIEQDHEEKTQGYVGKVGQRFKYNESVELTEEDWADIVEDQSMDAIVEFMMDEEYQSLDELSKKTLGSYIKKAAGSSTVNATAAMHGKNREAEARADAEYYRKAKEPENAKRRDAYADVQHKASYNATETSIKRLKGIAKATDRLTKESEEIEELSKSTLGSYIKKANAKRSSDSISDHEAEVRGNGVMKAADKLAGSNSGELKGLASGARFDAATRSKNASAQKSNFEKSVDRLTKESEDLEELSKDLLQRYQKAGDKQQRSITKTIDRGNSDRKTHMKLLDKRSKRENGWANAQQRVRSGYRWIADSEEIEEVSSVDELSKSTLDSYLKKAVKDLGDKTGKADRLIHAAGVEKNKIFTTQRRKDAAQAVADAASEHLAKRHKGATAAATRLKAESEELEEVKKDSFGMPSHHIDKVKQKIRDGIWEPQTDLKANAHVEIRHTKTGKRETIHVRESEELDEALKGMGESTEVVESTEDLNIQRYAALIGKNLIKE